MAFAPGAPHFQRVPGQEGIGAGLLPLRCFRRGGAEATATETKPSSWADEAGDQGGTKTALAASLVAAAPGPPARALQFLAPIWSLARRLPGSNGRESGCRSGH